MIDSHQILHLKILFSIVYIDFYDRNSKNHCSYAFTTMPFSYFFKIIQNKLIK